MPKLEVVYTYKTQVSVHVPQYEIASVQKALNEYHGWPGWQSLEPDDGSVEPSKELLNAHYRMHQTQRFEITVGVMNDGSCQILEAPVREG